MIGHNVTSAVAMATIAHKGTVAGAKAMAMTVLDDDDTGRSPRPELFNTVQQKYGHYKPFLSASDVPAIHVNDDYMRTYRPLMEPIITTQNTRHLYRPVGDQISQPAHNGIRKIAPSICWQGRHGRRLTVRLRRCGQGASIGQLLGVSAVAAGPLPAVKPAQGLSE
jgi:hypothetical protein